MKLSGGLEDILHKMKDNVKDGFRKFKAETNRSIEYLDEKLKKIVDKTYEKLEETKNKISEYGPVIAGYALLLSPYTRASLSAGSYIEEKVGGLRGKVAKYVLIAVGAAATVGTLFGIHALPSHNEHIQYLGKGYEAFVPNGQTINYNGQTDPVGDLILSNGTTLHNVIWNGQYASTIINNHNQMVQLNGQFVGQTDPINHQPYKPLQDVYVIDGSVPIKLEIINGQTYYVIEANKINPADIAGFYTYDKWVPNFVAAMNMPGTTAASVVGNSPVYDWTNITGTLVYQTQLYGHYGSFSGRYILVLPNNTIIPYGVNIYIEGSSFNKYVLTPVYNSSS